MHLICTFGTFDDVDGNEDDFTGISKARNHVSKQGRQSLGPSNIGCVICETQLAASGLVYQIGYQTSNSINTRYMRKIARASRRAK